MKYSFLSLIVAAVLTSLWSCNESSTIGTSLTEETITIHVDSAFTVTGKTQDNKVVRSLTTSQLLGSLDAPGFGTIESDFVAQFMPSVQIDTAGVTVNDIDSAKMFIQMARTDFTGDSLAPMGIEVFRLTKDLPYPIYSNFGDSIKDFYNPSERMTSGMYIASTLNEPDSIKRLKNIYVRLPLKVDFAREIFNAYKSNPANFTNPEKFATDVFKGIYVRTSYGAGRISDFTVNSIRFYYHKTKHIEDSKRDTIIDHVGDYFAVSPEVIVNNNIQYKPAQTLIDMKDAGEHLLAAPAGYELEIRFPTPEIIESYNKSANETRVINTLTFTLPVDTIANEYSIAPPPYVLMVLKSKKDEFFAGNKINDDLTSFYGTYNPALQSYTFSSMRKYILEMLEKDEITPDDYTFIITPVQVTTESSSNSGYYYGSSFVVSRITPYVSKPAMAKVLLDEAKIYFTFATGNNKNY